MIKENFDNSLNTLLSRYYSAPLDDLLVSLMSCIVSKSGANIVLHNSRVFKTYFVNEKYKKLCNEASYLIADGAPISWLAKLNGFDRVQQIRGISLFKGFMNYANIHVSGVSICMIVSTELIKDKILDKVEKEFQNLQNFNVIVAPWGDSEYICDEIYKETQHYQSEIVWVCLGAPKQDEVGSLLRKKNQSMVTVSIGVVAEYFAETVKAAPKIFVLFRVEWFFRILVQPKRSIYFVVPFFSMCKLLIMGLIKRVLNKLISGLK